MRALAHPTRMALLEVLSLHGELTATQAAALVGESPSSCSFHLRTLAKHGFIEEAGGGQGRQRPWRLAHLGMNIPSSAEGEASVAADALSNMFVDRQLDRLKRWLSRRGQTPAEWRGAATITEVIAWLTPEELKELNQLVYEQMDTYKDRVLEPERRPEGAKPVELQYFSYPVEDWNQPPAAP